MKVLEETKRQFFYDINVRNAFWDKNLNIY